MKNDLYVVGLIPPHIREQIIAYQQKLSRLYNLYEDYYPELHITLAKLSYDSPHQIIQLSNSLSCIFANHKPLHVEIQGTSCFGSPYKSVNLHVATNTELKNLSETIINAAKGMGLTYDSPFAEWQYHISVASPVFADKEWSESEYEQACILLTAKELHKHFLINTVQIWLPVKDDYVKGSYEFRD